jgi:uncharacterized protein (DUF1501 family)
LLAELVGTVRSRGRGVENVTLGAQPARFTASARGAADLLAGGAVRGGHGIAAWPRPAYIASGLSGRSSRRTRIAMTVMMRASTVAPAPMVSAVVTPLDSA